MLIPKHAKQNLLGTLYGTQKISDAWESIFGAAGKLLDGARR